MLILVLVFAGPVLVNTTGL